MVGYGSAWAVGKVRLRHGRARLVRSRWMEKTRTVSVGRKDVFRVGQEWQGESLW